MAIREHASFGREIFKIAFFASFFLFSQGRGRGRGKGKAGGGGGRGKAAGGKSGGKGGAPKAKTIAKVTVTPLLLRPFPSVPFSFSYTQWTDQAPWCSC